jgi:aminopeptidase-like protein
MQLARESVQSHREEAGMSDAELYSLAERLLPLPRTVQGPAVIQTLNIIGDWLGPTTPWPKYHDVPVGTRVFDWTVLPDSDNRRAYHPSLADVPAYDGPLTYAESVIPGESLQEILLSTYTCHPQLANDNVSGMVVTAALTKWLASVPRRYTYRVLFAPETIGALCWLHQRSVAARRQELDLLRMHEIDVSVPWLPPIIAGYTINCCGDERAWSFLPSRKGDTLADRAARHVLGQMVRPGGWIARKGDGMQWAPFITEYPFADRGSDERQFCAPGVDLPIASVMRSKHGTFPEYHTSADDLSVISAKGLGDSFRCYQRIFDTIEANRTYRVATIGEPRLDKHGLYPTSGGPDEQAKIARDLCAYADGETDLIAIAEATGRAVWEIAQIADALRDAGLLSEVV